MSITKKYISNCDGVGGKLIPIVNYNDCGAKKDCVAICPYDVLEMRPIDAADKANLNLKGKLKTFFFIEKAYITDASLCQACGLCVQACPEKAIRLTKFVF